MISQMVQNKIKDKKLKQSKDETKFSFCGSNCGTKTVF